METRQANQPLAKSLKHDPRLSNWDDRRRICNSVMLHDLFFRDKDWSINPANQVKRTFRKNVWPLKAAGGIQPM